MPDENLVVAFYLTSPEKAYAGIIELNDVLEQSGINGAQVITQGSGLDVIFKNADDKHTFYRAYEMIDQTTVEQLFGNPKWLDDDDRKAILGLQ